MLPFCVKRTSSKPRGKILTRGDIKPTPSEENPIVRVDLTNFKYNGRRYDSLQVDLSEIVYVLCKGHPSNVDDDNAGLIEEIGYYKFNLGDVTMLWILNSNIKVPIGINCNETMLKDENGVRYGTSAIFELELVKTRIQNIGRVVDLGTTKTITSMDIRMYLRDIYKQAVTKIINEIGGIEKYLTGDNLPEIMDKLSRTMSALLYKQHRNDLLGLFRVRAVHNFRLNKCR